MTGWICPKCGRVYAPSCQQCLFCNCEEAFTIIAHDDKEGNDFIEQLKREARKVNETE